MKILDLKKQYKGLYQPSAKKPVLVQVPNLQFAMIDGYIELKRHETAQDPEVTLTANGLALLNGHNGQS